MDPSWVWLYGLDENMLKHVKTIPSHGRFVGFVAMNLYGSLWVGLKYIPSQTVCGSGLTMLENYSWMLVI